jgi:alanine racemase
MAIIKANGYGHGLVAVANALAAADAFGVARLDEALALREAGIEKSIVLLEGVFSRDELNEAAHARFEIVVHTDAQIELLEASAHAREFAVWLKVDTGMNRLGFRLEEFPTAYQRLQRTEPRALRLMAHLSAAESRDGSIACEQIDAFRSVTDGIDAERTIANSAGVILWDEARTEWVRPGLMLYGISPIPGVSAIEIGLRPVMTLSTQLISVRTIHVGETVGYNGTWQAARESKIGIAAVGYGDGYPRNIRSGTPVLVNGLETVVVGRVSMDMTAVDVTDMDAKIGDLVTLWGQGLPAERIAPYADTIAYELICGISQRVAADWR